jgi:hypothetical protein
MLVLRMAIISHTSLFQQAEIMGQGEWGRISLFHRTFFLMKQPEQLQGQLSIGARANSPAPICDP